jgi:hypothetical protein
MAIMFDLPGIHNVSEGKLAFRKRSFKAWEWATAKQEDELAIAGVMAWRRPGTIIKRMYVTHSDLPDLSGSPPPSHRYYWPWNATNGFETMLLMPKCDFIAMDESRVGEEVLVRHYFWADIRAVAKFTGTIEEDELLEAMSDIVDEIQPMPMGEWVPPSWNDLPGDFNLRTGPMRSRVLVERR